MPVLRQARPGGIGKSSGFHFRKFYLHVSDNADFAKEVIGQAGGDAVLHYMDGILRRGIRESFPPSKGMVGELLQLHELKIEAAAAAVTALVHDWLKRGMKIKPETMALHSGTLLESIFPPSR